MTAEPVPSAPASRRQRVRQATLEEIRRTARQLLVRGGPAALTLRAVGREMGMTAPALYRYVDSHEDLVELVTIDCYDELVATMTAARASVAEEDPAAGLLAVSRAFRRWSLDHPAEFGLVFAQPVMSLVGPCTCEIEAAGQRFGAVFADLFGQVLQRYRPPLPEIDDIDPAFVRALADFDEQCGGLLPLGAQYLYLSCWIRLYGCVCMEVFGHVRWAMTDSEPLFEDVLRQLAEQLGIGEAYRPPATRV